MDFQQLDFKMLRCLDALVTDAGVTRAAERLNMSQPQLSSLLSRMRKIFNDPLLVRTPTGMQPTKLALEIAGHARKFLDSCQGTMDNRGDFAARTSTRMFNIVAQDSLVHLYISSFIGTVRQVAPNILLSLSLPPISETIENLKTGDNDLAVGLIPTVPEEFYITRLLTSQRICIASSSHPTLRGTISLEEFAASHHVVSTLGQSYLPTVSEQRIDAALRGHGLTRRIGVYVQGALSVPEIVARSDLIAVVPRGLALHAGTSGNLQMFPLPFDCPPSEISLIWHARTHHDAALQWLRRAIKEWAVQFEARAHSGDKRDEFALDDTGHPR
jgi:DNA-binding transcriptional LysR family regulator